MSAVAGIAKKVIGALPVVGNIAKGAWNIGKKVVGGIKNIFTGGKKKAQEGAQQAVQQVGGMVDTGRQMYQQGQGLYNTGRDIYNGFRQGGFSGGMAAIGQRLPGMMQGVGSMIDSGRQMWNQGQGLYNTGRDMYQQGRDMFNQGRGIIQGGMNDMQDMMRRRKGGMMRPQVMPY